MLKLHDLSPRENSQKSKRRVGRGRGSGMGGTSTRGDKGQNARSGGGVSQYFEGGQIPIARRLPKRGFNSMKETKGFFAINLDKLSQLNEDLINIEILKEKKLVPKRCKYLVVLGDGEVNKSLTVEAFKVSRNAKEKLEKAGAQVKELRK